MIASFQSFDKSPGGVFIQSPNKVRNTQGGVMTIAFMSDAFDYKNDIDTPAEQAARQAVHRSDWDDETEENGDAERIFLCHTDSGFPFREFEFTMSNEDFGEPPDIDMYISPAAFQMDIDSFISDVYQPAVDIMGKPDVVWLLLTEEFDGQISEYDPYLKEFQTEFLLEDQDISSTCWNTTSNPDITFEGGWLSDLLHFRKFPLAAPFAPWWFPFFEDDDTTLREYGPIKYAPFVP